MNNVQSDCPVDLIASRLKLSERVLKSNNDISIVEMSSLLPTHRKKRDTQQVNPGDREDVISSVVSTILTNFSTPC